MSARSNQVVLESDFSQITDLGGFYDHPLPTGVKQRIKYLLSRNTAVIIPTENYSWDDFIRLSAKLIYGNATNKTVNCATGKNSENNICH